MDFCFKRPISTKRDDDFRLVFALEFKGPKFCFEERIYIYTLPYELSGGFIIEIV